MNHPIIKRLPDHLINQIKAGEVIDRPINVIKELVENAIDALATQIKIELLDGGKKLIQVSDNGVGISYDQVQIASERHTTSKIFSFDDLQTLKSFGFRGEALASIISVSKFSIKTKTADKNLGIEVLFDREKISSTKEVAMNNGTTITVKELFYNIPARSKFLRSTSTEFALISEFLRAMSLNLPKISFELIHNGRRVFDYRSQHTLEERFSEILGLEAHDYTNIDFTHGSFCIEGFAIFPDKVKTIQNTITTFVNKRFIKDRFLRSSIYSAYQGLLLKGMKPSAYLFMNLDAKQIDVNVHPAKTEVRFLDPLFVQDLIARSIENAVKTKIQEDLSKNFLETSRVKHSLSSQIHTNSIQQNSFYSDKTRYQNLAKLKHDFYDDTDTKNLTDSSINHNNNDSMQNFEKLSSSQEKFPNPSLFIIKQTTNLFDNTIFLGQFLKCYLLFEKQSELLIVDQHAFHERVLYEEIQASYKINSIPKQNFINPTVISLDPLIEHIFLENKNLILDLGFQTELLSNHTLAIHSAPSFLLEKYIIEIFVELTSKLSQHKHTNSTQLYHDFFATLACHGAVRSGDPLSEEFVKKLINRAKDVDFFAHCPHGRPVIRKFSKNDVERWFERI